MIVPAVNTVGIFNFSEPFNNIIKSNQQFKVASVRALVELEQSGEKPFDTIYKPVGLTEVQFKDDLVKNIPIVVFTTDGGDFFYVPANKIASEPITTGVPYREYGLMVNLGYIPTDLNLDIVESLIKDAVYNSISVTPDLTLIPTSAKISVEETKHKEFMLLIDNKKKIDKSYQTRYYELLELYNKQQTLIKTFEKMYKENICSKG